MTKEATDCEQLYDLICGTGSMLDIFARTAGLRHLVIDVVVETFESIEADAHAANDPDDPDGETPMISVATGVYDGARERLERWVERTETSGRRPWARFGDARSVCDLASRLVLDMVVLHELGHIGRGHVDRSLSLDLDGIWESDRPQVSSPMLSSTRRMALELDADSFAYYHFIELRALLRDASPAYATLRSDEDFLALLGLSTYIMFSMLSERHIPPQRSDGSAASLADLHRGASHPIPSVRGEFAHQRIMQLASVSEEAERFSAGLDRATELFIDMLHAGVFSAASMAAWTYDTRDVADFLNLLIDEIPLAMADGWIDETGGRLARALRGE